MGIVWGVSGSQLPESKMVGRKARDVFLLVYCNSGLWRMGRQKDECLEKIRIRWAGRGKKKPMDSPVDAHGLIKNAFPPSP